MRSAAVAVAVAATLAAGGGLGDYIDLSADDTARLSETVHIDGKRAAAIEAELKAADIWQGVFLDPWVWRRQAN